MDWIGLKKSFSNPFYSFYFSFILVFTTNFFKTLNSFWRWRSFFQGKVLTASFLACYLVKCPTAKDDWAS
ncbi:hypothetical protein BB483_05080 [Helicobacter pylori]|nr:hypothetical protein BB483_05080 [Helicobacter pylori]